MTVEALQTGARNAAATVVHAKTFAKIATTRAIAINVFIIPAVRVANTANRATTAHHCVDTSAINVHACMEHVQDGVQPLFAAVMLVGAEIDVTNGKLNLFACRVSLILD